MTITLPLECVHCLRRGSTRVELDEVDLAAPDKAVAANLPKGWTLVQVSTPAGRATKIACPRCGD